MKLKLKGTFALSLLIVIVLMYRNVLTSCMFVTRCTQGLQVASFFAFNASRLFHFLPYNEGLTSTTYSPAGCVPAPMCGVSSCDAVTGSPRRALAGLMSIARIRVAVSMLVSNV